MSYGFGHGPFGRDPFGEANWSRALYEALPEFYLAEDENQEFFLEKWQEALRGPVDVFRRKIREYLDLRDPLKVRTQYNEVSRLRLGPRVLPSYPIEQRGFDGSIDATRAFSARTARFKAQDRGKDLTIKDSLIVANNVTVRIAAVINANTVLTDPRLSVDAGPVRWELRQPITVDESRITLEIRGGDVSQIVPGWQLFDGAATFEVTSRRRFRDRFREKRLLTDKEGGDATIDALGRLVSPTAGFTQLDVGRPVSFTESDIPENNAVFEIKKIISASIVELTTPATETTLPFRWAYYPFPLIEIVGPAVPRGVVEQEAQDLEGVLLPNGFKSARANFTAADVGKRLSVRGSTLTNDGIYEVVSVLTQNQITVTPATVVAEAPGMTWALRKRTIVGDTTQVDANAPSMITLLAPDFGITVDTQKSEARQRAWVRFITLWIDKKGHPESYAIIGALSGFDVTAETLFHVSLDFSFAIPPASLFELGDAGVGRLGTDGHLSLGTGGRVRFDSGPIFPPGVAQFTAGDAGKLIRISGTPAVPANDKLYQIENVLSAKAVEFRLSDTATLPDLRTLTWAVVGLYTTLPPLQPRFDEINGDLLVSIVPPGAFGLDMYCWETTPVPFSTDVALTISAVAPVSLNIWQVTVTGVPPNSANVVVAVGSWEIEDSTGTAFFLETVPADSLLGPWTFLVNSSIAPATGAAILRYVCQLQLSCDYCQSYKVLFTIVPDGILADVGVAVERVYERVLEDLALEAKPAHVQLVQRLQVNIGAQLALRATTQQIVP